MMASKILIFIGMNEIDAGHFMFNYTYLILLPDR